MNTAFTLATAWRAISQGAQDAERGPEALLEALATVAGALAARLYYPDGENDYVAMAEWCWPMAAGEPRGLELTLDATGEGLVLLEGGVGELPLADPAAWALLPLRHHGRLSAVVVLACPAVPQTPDDATREALVLAARMAACHIAADRAQAMLDEAARFSAFHRDLAFATHDIKGISSQLALLASNAERLGDNPDFRADMLITLRAATARLDGLMERLAVGKRAGVAMDEPHTEAQAGGADIGDIARSIAARFAHRHQVSVIEREACAVLGKRAALEQVLSHLVSNAVEASPPTAPVFVAINADGAMARLEIIDSGHGMSPQFLSQRLFRPFDSSKPDGFGIGAYEAREMVRAMGGRLDVESRLGVGTRFVIRVPLAANAARAAL